MTEVATPMIYKDITKAMAEIGAIAKDNTNKQQGFKYRGVDDVMNALNPVLINNGIFMVPEILEHIREERTTTKGGNLIYSVCKIRYTFYAADGSSVNAVVIGEGMDSGDKATNKAMSIAFKYACFQVFCIPTEEMEDPDKECHEVTWKMGEAEMVEILKELSRTGLSDRQICKQMQVERLEAMTKEQYEICMATFKKTASKGAK